MANASDKSWTQSFVRRRLDEPSFKIVNRTRPVAFKWLAVLLGMIRLTIGLRDIFFCGIPVNPYDETEREMLKEVFGNCEGRQQTASAILGVGIVFNGVVCLSFAFTTHIADLARTATMMTAWDAMLGFVLWRDGTLPLFYNILCLACVLYGAFIACNAWVAANERAAMKESALKSM